MLIAGCFENSVDSKYFLIFQQKRKIDDYFFLKILRQLSGTS
jgi:hypothetical protein